MASDDRNSETELHKTGGALSAILILGGGAEVVTYALLAGERPIGPSSIALTSAILAGGVVGMIAAKVPLLHKLVAAIFRMGGF